MLATIPGIADHALWYVEDVTYPLCAPIYEHRDLIIKHMIGRAKPKTEHVYIAEMLVMCEAVLERIGVPTDKSGLAANQCSRVETLALEMKLAEALSMPCIKKAKPHRSGDASADECGG